MARCQRFGGTDCLHLDAEDKVNGEGQSKGQIDIFLVRSQIKIT
jgi:hypothetical protein